MVLQTGGFVIWKTVFHVKHIQMALIPYKLTGKTTTNNKYEHN